MPAARPAAADACLCPAGAPSASRISFPLRDSFVSSILRIFDIDRGYVSARQGSYWIHAFSIDRASGVLNPLLEFSRPLFRPALDHHFLLREKLDRVTSLRMQVAKEAFARAAERKECHRCGNPDIDADIAHFSLVPELPRRGTARGENA